MFADIFFHLFFFLLLSGAFRVWSAFWTSKNNDTRRYSLAGLDSARFDKHFHLINYTFCYLKLFLAQIVIHMICGSVCLFVSIAPWAGRNVKSTMTKGELYWEKRNRSNLNIWKLNASQTSTCNQMLITYTRLSHKIYLNEEMFRIISHFNLLTPIV